MRLKRILIIGTIFPVLFSIVLFFGILISGEDDDSSNSYSPVYSGMNLSADVLKHQSMVEKYARENGISEYVNVLLAIIQVESGGTATDVMQSSESLGLPPNSLSTEESIKQGCKYFASLLSSCKAKGMNDINVAFNLITMVVAMQTMWRRTGKSTALTLQRISQRINPAVQK